MTLAILVGAVVGATAPERLELLQRDPARQAEMSRAARECARQFSWGKYEKTLAACVGLIIGKN